MNRFLMEMFVVSLGLTIIIECSFAFLMHIRDRRRLGLVVLVNLLTNPAAVLLALIWKTGAAFAVTEQWAANGYVNGFFYVALELLVVGVEARVYQRRMDGLGHPWRFSLLANGCSYLLGLALEGII